MNEKSQSESAGEEENREKSVDSDWKQKVQQEKEEVRKQQEGPRESYPEANFQSIIGGIGIQAAIALGQVENPATGEQEKDLEQAKHFIDSLKVLEEKTEGNLTEEEKNHLEALLAELQMGYTREVKEQGGTPEEDSDTSTGDTGPAGSGGGQQSNIYTPGT